ncbi:MAG TPA: cytochrome C [Desulfuromonadaceae bacterium]
MTRCRGYLPLILALIMFAAPIVSFATEPTLIVCIQCHSGLPERLGQPVKDWRGSIHAENGIACNNCHGGDPRDAANAMTPERGFLGAPQEKAIPAFCGRCHIGVMNDYLYSAHGRALGRGGPTCVTCHGNHLIVKASLELINEKSCSRCHSYDRARLMKNTMQQTDDLIAGIEKKIGGYKQIGVDCEHMEKGLFAARNRFHVLFHEVNAEKVKIHAGEINSDLKTLQVELQKLDDTHRKRKVAGLLAVTVALVTALLLYLLKKTYDTEDEL